jgi:UDP-N-acetylmuramate: L-alanyl-gamma-D-glutamyl-meso-diaminopimelate ligase
MQPKSHFIAAMKIHLIAIGGSAMHNLALALHHAQHEVSGSDDEIFEPSRSRLAAQGLLPAQVGWFPDKIHANLDCIILGMHAHADNPELAKARSLNIPVYSYPAFLYEQTKTKQRVVVGGSHGKTTTTSMIMHVLQHHSQKFDYLVGALIEGFERSVLVEAKHEVALFEGDEYLASTLDPRPKFHLYKPHIAVITGIAWDHMNVFPTFANYLEQFSIFIDSIEPGGTLIYSSEDTEVAHLVEGHPRAVSGELQCLPYTTPPYQIENGQTYLLLDGERVQLRVFGQHNLQNMEGARLVCAQLGIDANAFYEAITHFSGASRRLEKLHESADFTVYRDFAHAPSKLKATTHAVKEQHPNRKLIALMELHTYSSLNKDFLGQYNGAMHEADIACVYYSPEVVAHKRLPAISIDEVKAAFGRPDLTVFTSNLALQTHLDGIDKSNAVLLLMSSGNWGGGIHW